MDFSKYQIDYWKDIFYNMSDVTMNPSSFAKYVLSIVSKNDKILDVCCGNGRDSLYFLNNGLDVYSFDINELKDTAFNFKNINLCDKPDRFTFEDNFDIVYCRFVLHSIPENIEDYILLNSNKVLNNDGLLFIEARSDKGSLNNVRMNHYRRLINLELLKDKLCNIGFEVIFCLESDGLSIYNNEDPVLLRIVARKRVNLDTTFKLDNEILSNNKPLNIDSAKWLLLKTKYILDANDIKFLLVFGTLLGAYRNKDFIPYDTDVDIALKAEEKEKVLKLIEEGYFKLYGMIWIRNEVNMYSLKYKDDYIDLAFYKGYRNIYRCGIFRMAREQFDLAPTKIQFLGETFYTVANIKKYLVARYGNRWMIPVRNKHAII